MFSLYYNDKKDKAYCWNYIKGIKKEISKEQYDSIESLIETHENMGKELIESIFDEIVQERNSAKRAFTMFDSEQVFLSDIFLNLKNVEYVFVGFPYDLGSSQYRGSKFGPDILRYTSTAITDSANLRRHKIELGDIGNIKGDFFTTNGKEFMYLTTIVEYLICHKKFPIILGGDHSISFSTILGVCSSKNKFGILHFDAHQDYGKASKRDWSKNLNHSNFLEFLIEKEEIVSVTQLGIRNNNFSCKHEKLVSYSVEEVLENLDDIVDSLDNTIPYFMTFDVDCLSTSIMTSTGTPLPGGFEFREISKILSKLLSKINIIGCDIVELTDSNRLDAMLINQLLLLIFIERSKSHE